MEYDKQTKNRLKRVEGQVRGILRMMEEKQDCEKVINQLSAVCSAVNHTIGVIVTENLKMCLQTQNETNSDTDELVKEAIKLLVKSR
ncbi:metal-sensitive transcriptional regulator [Neobacillus sp. SM06]|uniref:metal-sensitive transcriptional regulator n=1 Tax=Neobacillus sp. SM06 TaxID=3422492 RepID=UPI003D2B5113